MRLVTVVISALLVRTASMKICLLFEESSCTFLGGRSSSRFPTPCNKLIFMVMCVDAYSSYWSVPAKSDTAVEVEYLEDTDECSCNSGSASCLY